jgi:hypothetical protein
MCYYRTSATAEILYSQNGNSTVTFYFNDEKQSTATKSFSSVKDIAPVSVRYIFT